MVFYYVCCVDTARNITGELQTTIETKARAETVLFLYGPGMGRMSEKDGGTKAKNNKKFQFGIYR